MLFYWFWLDGKTGCRQNIQIWSYVSSPKVLVVDIWGENIWNRVSAEQPFPRQIIPAPFNGWVTDSRLAHCSNLSVFRDIKPIFCCTTEKGEYLLLGIRFFFSPPRNILKIRDNHSLNSSVLHRHPYLEILKRETAKNEACTRAQKVCLQGFCPCLLSPRRKQTLLQKPPCPLGLSRPWHKEDPFAGATKRNASSGHFTDVSKSRIWAPDCRTVLLISLWSNSVQLCGEILECGLSFTHSSAICLKPKAIGRKTSYLATDHWKQ